MDLSTDHPLGHRGTGCFDIASITLRFSAAVAAIVSVEVDGSGVRIFSLSESESISKSGVSISKSGVTLSSRLFCIVPLRVRWLVEVEQLVVEVGHVLEAEVGQQLTAEVVSLRILFAACSTSVADLPGMYGVSSPTCRMGAK